MTGLLEPIRVVVFCSRGKVSVGSSGFRGRLAMEHSMSTLVLR